MKSDINPHCPVWKLRTLRTMVHRGARVPVNKCVQPSWVLSWPHSLGHECACWTLQFSSSQQLITDKMMKKDMSICAGGAKLCLLALRPAQVWPHGHNCPGVAAQQPGYPWCSMVAIPECSGNFIPLCCHFGAMTVCEDMMNQNASCTAEWRCRSTVTALVSFVCNLCCRSLGRSEGRSWRCWAVPFGKQGSSCQIPWK